MEEREHGVRPRAGEGGPGNVLVAPHEQRTLCKFVPPAPRARAWGRSLVPDRVRTGSQEGSATNR